MRTGLQMDGGAVRLGLLHGPANPHGLLVQIARGNAEGDVQAAVGMPSEGLVARAHLVVVQVVAGGDDHGLRVYLLVRPFLAHDGARHGPVAFAQQASAWRFVTVLDAQLLALLDDGGDEHGHAQALRHAVEVHEVGGVVVEEVRDGLLGVVGALVVAGPQCGLQARFGHEVDQPVHARARFLGELPQQRFFHAAGSPLDQAPHDVRVVGLFEPTLIHVLLHELRSVGRDVSAASGVRVALVDAQRFRALLRCGDRGDGAGESAAHYEHVHVLGSRDLVGGDVGRRRHERPFDGRVGSQGVAGEARGVDCAACGSCFVGGLRAGGAAGEAGSCGAKACKSCSNEELATRNPC